MRIKLVMNVTGLTGQHVYPIFTFTSPCVENSSWLIRNNRFNSYDRFLDEQVYKRKCPSPHKRVHNEHL